MNRSTHHMPFNKDFTCNFGAAIPVFSRQLVPGTTWRMDLDSLVRAQAMLAPALGRVRITLNTYFVPNRLVDDEWEDRMTGGEDGTASPAMPTVTAPVGGWLPGSLQDFFGWPTGVAGVVCNAYKPRSYASIYNNYIRDQQLMPAVGLSTAVGNDTTTNDDLLYGANNRDYFNKARPSPQLGTPVAIPLAGSAPITGRAPVMGIGTDAGNASAAVANVRQSDLSTSNMPVSYRSTTSAIVYAMTGTVGSTNGFPAIFADADETNSTMEADLALVAGPTAEEIRELSVIQRFKEMMNNFGARYVEYLQSRFGISPQDARLQLPEYVGGGQFLLQISEVLQTSATGEEGTPLATLAGHGIGKGNQRRIKYFVKEHGTLMTIMMIRPDTQYSQGIPREDMYNDRFDWLDPDFANLGDQEVWAGEVFATGDSTDRDVWAYTPRYDEQTFIPSTYHGELKKDQPLNYWTLGLQYPSRPALGPDFVTCVGTDRIFAVKTVDQFIVRIRGNVKAKLPLPKNRQPRLK